MVWPYHSMVRHDWAHPIEVYKTMPKHIRSVYSDVVIPTQQHSMTRDAAYATRVEETPPDAQKVITIVATRLLSDLSGWLPVGRRDGFRQIRGIRGKGVDVAHMGEFDLGQRPVLIIDRNAFHGVECGVMTIYYLAKDSIF